MIGRKSLFLLGVLTFFLPIPAFAFDYLEHSYFSDLACVDAQKKSQGLLKTEKDAARFLGLSLFCPLRNIDQYCKGGYKGVHSSVNLVDDNDFGVTLGDIAALPDHISKYGPIKNLVRAGKGGFSLFLIDWLSNAGNVGGVIEDVAEDACEYDTEIIWSELNREITDDIRFFEKEGLPQIHRTHLSAIARKAPKKGPNDPATKYTLDNPHYLDLVLRNHTHFGASAYDAWLGFHQIGQEIANRSCEEVVDFSAGEVENLAENLDMDDKDWSDQSEAELARSVCDLLGIAASRRVKLLQLEQTKNSVLNAFLLKVEKGDRVARDSVIRHIYLEPSNAAGTIKPWASLAFVSDGTSDVQVVECSEQDSQAGILMNCGNDLLSYDSNGEANVSLTFTAQ